MLQSAVWPSAVGCACHLLWPATHKQVRVRSDCNRHVCVCVCSALPPLTRQVWLASQQPGVAGVVLHSPLLSGVRVFNPNLRWWPSWADIFPNHLLVKKIDVPLLVMHGTADEVGCV